MSELRLRALLATALALSAGVCRAQTPPASPTNLTLAAALEFAARDNPGLKSLRAQWEALQERPRQARALANPVAKYGGMDATGSGDWPDTGEKRFGVEQSFPWFGKRNLRAGIAEKDAEAMRHELDTLAREIVMQVKESYFSLYAAQQAIRITRGEETVLQRMAKISETLYATGVRTQQDVLKARSEITLLKQRLLELGAQESTLQAQLNALLGRRADAPFGDAVTPPDTAYAASRDDLFVLASASRPEIRAAQTRIERAELETRLMDKESRPDYQLGVEYRDIGGGDNMVMFTVGVELPIWQSKNRAAVSEARRKKAASEADLESARLASSLDVQSALIRLQTAQRSLGLYTAELIPQAEARFSASEADYQTGKADFMDFLESERFLLGARVMAATAEGDVGVQLARLERAVGSDLNPPKERAAK